MLLKMLVPSARLRGPLAQAENIRSRRSKMSDGRRLQGVILRPETCAGVPARWPGDERRPKHQPVGLKRLKLCLRWITVKFAIIYFTFNGHPSVRVLYRVYYIAGLARGCNVHICSNKVGE